MHGGEILVPKMPSMKLLDMAQAVAPNCQIECVGIRPGEKLHEVLLSGEEARNSVGREDMFVIQQAHFGRPEENWKDGVPLDEGFCYASDTNSEWLTAEDLYKHVEGAAPPLSSTPNRPEHRIQ
jgi:UDP-N-acetylglucosamine 4,6-dehydratase